jgi:flagellar basal-body rod protein FlgC
MNISAEGLSVQRTRMNVVSENLANIDTTRTEDGTPYRRQIVQIERGRKDEPRFIEVFQKNRLEMNQTQDKHFPAKPFKDFAEDPKFGVHVADVVKDPSAFKLIYDPSHPDANYDGYVEMPNINPVQEMIDLITASRSYEANVTALNSSKEMVRSALRISN